MWSVKLLFLITTASLGLAAPSLSRTAVRASTGYYSGKINGNYSNVREFLNVPYGQFCTSNPLLRQIAQEGPQSQTYAGYTLTRG